MPFQVKSLALAFVLASAGPALAYDAFVTNEKGNSVSVIDTDSLTVKKTIPVSQRPRGIVASPDKSKIYVALGDTDTIAVIDPHTYAVVEEFPAGRDPERIDISPDHLCHQ
jgi:YVTN family beta-propeller protein